MCVAIVTNQQNTDAVIIELTTEGGRIEKSRQP